MHPCNAYAKLLSCFSSIQNFGQQNHLNTIGEKKSDIPVYILLYPNNSATTQHNNYTLTCCVPRKFVQNLMHHTMWRCW